MDCLTSKRLFSVFGPHLPTGLHTDASATVFWEMLLQKEDHNVRVVGYYSKRTTETEYKYHSYELETPAVINAQKKSEVTYVE